MTTGIVSYWDDYFLAVGVDISFEVKTGNPCSAPYDIKIQIVSPSQMYNVGAVAEANLTQNMRGSSIYVNENYLSSGISWEGLAAHELGHLLDFKDVSSSSCSGETVMYANVAPLPSSLTCADKTAVSSRYIANSVGQGETTKTKVIVVKSGPRFVTGGSICTATIIFQAGFGATICTPNAVRQSTNRY